MGTEPNGWQTPKTNWTTADPVGNGDLNRIEGNINAVELGDRTIDDAQVPSSDTGNLRQFLDWLANRLKAITGKTNWFDAPTASIETMMTTLLSLSLTNYDSGVVPQIAAGSRVIVKDTPIYFPSDTTITGTPTADSINYITVSTAGVPAWTDTAPVWKDAYQQYMDAGETLRYVGECHYDGTNYQCKYVYPSHQRDLKRKIPIGDWDMSAPGVKIVAHGLAFSKIRTCYVMIRKDDSASLRALYDGGSNDHVAGWFYIDVTNINLYSNTGETFDGTSYDDTPFNRGWVTIEYER